MGSLHGLIFRYRAFLLIFLLALGLRLWHITNPLLDEHSWRQTGSAIVARNYMDNTNFFQPTVDFDYRYPMAYGLYEYVVGVAGKIVGFSDLLGRLTALIVFCFGFIYFYKLVRRFFDEPTALWACAFYAFLPVAVFYTRAVQPDGSMVSTGIIFLYYFTKWVDEGKWQYYIASIVLANLTFLFKIPALFLFFPAAGYLFMKEKWKIFIDIKWYFLVLLSAAFPLIFHWYVPIATGGHIQSALFEQDKWGGHYWLQLEFWWKTFFINLSEYQFMHAGYIFLILGIFKKVTRREQWFFYFWVAGVFLFFVAVAKGMHHEYYYLPLMPVACVFIGRFLASFFMKFKERWTAGGMKRFAAGFVIFMVFYSFAFSMVRLNDRYKPNLNFLTLARIVAANTQPADHIIVFSWSEPEILYYSRRKGVNAHTVAELEQFLSSNNGQYTILAIEQKSYLENTGALSKILEKRYNILSQGPEGLVVKLPIKTNTDQ